DVLAGGETGGGELAREVEGERGPLRHVARLRARAARGLDGQEQAPAVHRARDLDGPRARVHGELERPYLERLVHLDGGVQADGAGRAEEGHLDLAVLLELEPVGDGQGLADHEADLVPAGID